MRLVLGLRCACKLNRDAGTAERNLVVPDEGLHAALRGPLSKLTCLISSHCHDVSISDIFTNYERVEEITSWS